MAMDITKMRIGMTLYKVAYEKAGNSGLKVQRTYPVRIVRLQMESRMVVASINGRPCRPYKESAWRQWRTEKPEPGVLS
jgi:hypothetical protein